MEQMPDTISTPLRNCGEASPQVPQMIFWLVVWLPSILFSQKYWVANHHPNWRSHIFQRGGEKPPTRWDFHYNMICYWIFSLGFSLSFSMFTPGQPVLVHVANPQEFLSGQYHHVWAKFWPSRSGELTAITTIFVIDLPTKTPPLLYYHLHDSPLSPNFDIK